MLSTIDLWSLKIGARLLLESEVVAEVINKTLDGQWVKVRYVRVPDSPALEGTEDLCSVDEVVSIEHTA